MVVDELVRLGGDAHLADERTVQGNDHEQDHGEETRYREKQQRLKAPVVYVEGESQQDAAHCPGK